MEVELTRVFVAEVAHYNPEGNPRTRRLHGHSVRIELVLRGAVTSPLGWLIDFGDIKKKMAPLYAQVDHHCLNDIAGLAPPTLPGLRQWLQERLRPELPQLVDVRTDILGDGFFHPVFLPEDPDSALPARVHFTFEAAQALEHLPGDHPCRKLHGHSYRVAVGAVANEALPPDLQTLYEELDHSCLNDRDDLGEATCERICYWFWQRLSAMGHSLTVVSVQETETSRCIYYGR